MRVLRLLSLVFVGMLLLVLMALAALDKPLLFCWPTFLLALAGLFLLIFVAFLRAGGDDRGAEAGNRDNGPQMVDG